MWTRRGKRCEITQAWGREGRARALKTGLAFVKRCKQKGFGGGQHVLGVGGVRCVGESEVGDRTGQRAAVGLEWRVSFVG